MKVNLERVKMFRQACVRHKEEFDHEVEPLIRSPLTLWKGWVPGHLLAMGSRVTGIHNFEKYLGYLAPVIFGHFIMSPPVILDLL